VREAIRYAPVPCKLTFDLLTLKVVSESRVTRATSVPISVFLGLSVLDFGPMYAIDRQTDRQTDVRPASSFNAHTMLNSRVLNIRIRRSSRKKNHHPMQGQPGSLITVVSQIAQICKKKYSHGNKSCMLKYKYKYQLCI